MVGSLAHVAALWPRGVARVGRVGPREAALGRAWPRLGRVRPRVGHVGPRYGRVRLPQAAS